MKFNAWREVLLEDVAAELTVGFVGSMTSEYVDLGIPFLRSKNVEPYGIKWDDMRFINREFHERLKKSALAPGDVVIVRTGKPGAAALIPKSLPEANCSDVVIVRPGSQLDARFLVYYLNSLAVHHVNAHLVGAVQQHFNVGSARKLSMKLPPLAQQQAIAHILGTLDDKIELNQQMNHTLEAIARALFKSWFIDFDPVRAKMDGRQPAGMDAETAALFPAEFEDSAIGKIPSGWEVKTLGDFIDIKHGYAFKGEFFRDQPPGDILLTPGNFAIGGGFKDDKFKYYLGEVPKEFVLAQGDLLVTMTDLSKLGDTLGYPAILPTEREGRYLHNQRLGKVFIKSENAIDKLYLYYLLRTSEYRQEILAGATGTTVKHTSPARIQAFKFFAPPSTLSLKFGAMVGSLFERKLLNDDENRNLAVARDALLPKLLSREVCIRYVKEVLEKVA